MKWIEASEKLPKCETWVLCVQVEEDGYAEPYIGYVDTEGHWFSKDMGHQMHDIQLWAELPEY